MSHTVSIRIPESMNRRLEERAKRTGRTRSAVVKEALERSLEVEPKPFMALAGSLDGTRNLSKRKGISKK
jgi:predicted DNA-binding protein